MSSDLSSKCESRKRKRGDKYRSQTFLNWRELKNLLGIIKSISGKSRRKSDWYSKRDYLGREEYYKERPYDKRYRSRLYRFLESWRRKPHRLGSVSLLSGSNSRRSYNKRSHL